MAPPLTPSSGKAGDGRWSREFPQRADSTAFGPRFRPDLSQLSDVTVEADATTTNDDGRRLSLSDPAGDAAGDGEVAALVELVEELLDLTVVLLEPGKWVGHGAPLMWCDECLL